MDVRRGRGSDRRGRPYTTVPMQGQRSPARRDLCRIAFSRDDGRPPTRYMRDMTILPVLRMGHPVLLAVAEPVGDPTRPEIQQLAIDMVETMEAEQGVGIAAPQVGRSLRLIVVLPISERGQDEEVEPLILADPVLEPVGEEIVDAVEGCLSIPGLRGQVPRYERVRWWGRDLDGEEIEGKAEGLFARILQHEVDHLDGILYPMRMTNLRSLGFVDAVPREPGDADGDEVDGGGPAANAPGEIER